MIADRATGIVWAKSQLLAKHARQERVDYLHIGGNLVHLRQVATAQMLVDHPPAYVDLTLIQPGTLEGLTALTPSAQQCLNHSPLILLTLCASVRGQIRPNLFGTWTVSFKEVLLTILLLRKRKTALVPKMLYRSSSSVVVFVPLEVLIHVFFSLIAGKLFGGIFQKSIKVRGCDKCDLLTYK